MTFYEDSILLLDRTQILRSNALVNDGLVINGDLKPWRIRLELSNQGVKKINAGTLHLKLDDSQTFIKNTPILVDEFAKNKYLIECKIAQGATNGKTFRFNINTSSIQTSESQGSILILNLIEIQYRLKESVASKRHYLQTPKQSFDNRIKEFNYEQGQYGVSIQSTGTNLPNTGNLKQHWLVESPTINHDLLTEIIVRLANAQVTGGTFKDYYFDFEPDIVTTTRTNVQANPEGLFPTDAVDIININPLSIETADSMEEQTAITDNQKWKNHIIVRGHPQGGSLPMDRTRFGSELLHARERDEWIGSTPTSYIIGDQVKKTWDISATSSKVIRFFECHKDVTSSQSPDQDTTHWTEDFVTIPEWEEYGRYDQFDIIYYRVYNEIKFYYAVNNIHNADVNTSNSANDPVTAGSSVWQPLHGAMDNRSIVEWVDYYTHSPWTKDLQKFAKNMGGQGTTLPHNMVGMIPDWNLTMDSKDKQDYTDQYESVSAKLVTSINMFNITDVEKKFDGQRYLLGDMSSAVAGNTFYDDWTSQGYSGTLSYRIAEFDAHRGKWRFSASPVVGDNIMNFDDGAVYMWSGSAWITGYAGDENRGWKFNTGMDDRPAPFHACRNLYKVKGSEGTPNTGIEARFLWYQPLDIGSDHSNWSLTNSRGSWLSFFFPYPHEATNPSDIGNLYGGNGSGGNPYAFINTFNLDYNSSGGTNGWNDGKNSEDMGRISVFRDSVDANGTFTGTGDTGDFTYLITGFDSVPMVFWAIDKFDRVWFHKFKLRRNNQWEIVTIPFSNLGVKDTSNMYFARWTELAKWWGYTSTLLDFTLAEKEFTGVKFDWRFVKGFGIFYEGSYHEKGLYTGGTDTFVDVLTQSLMQIGGTGYDVVEKSAQFWANAYNKASNLLDPDTTSGKEFEMDKSVKSNYIIRQSTLAIEDLHFVKDLMVNSDDSPVTNARTSIEHMGNEEDYINAKLYAKSVKARSSFFPQQWHLRSLGDVNMKLGYRFRVSGDRIPYNPDTYIAWSSATTYNKSSDPVEHNGYSWKSLVDGNTSEPEELINGVLTTSTDWVCLNELVCEEVKHIIDHSGYQMEVFGKRKFVTEGA